MTDIRVNTYTTGSQDAAAVAADAAGNYVVVWVSVGQDGSLSGIYGQLYGADGRPVGDEFLVNATTSNNQLAPRVAMSADGDFVVTWDSSGQDGDGLGIYGQRFAADGTPEGSEFLVNTYTTDTQATSTVAMDDDGNFVVAWGSSLQDGSSYGVFAQRYNASGEAQGSEFQVNTYTSSAQAVASVAMDADGDFILTWTSSGQDGSSSGIFAQRYNAAGEAQGDEFQVNTYTTNAQSGSSVAADDDGNFVIVWQSSGQDASSNGIYGQRYNAAGVAQGSEFRVNTYTTGNQVNSAVSMDSDGDFVVVWHSASQDAAVTASMRRITMLTARRTVASTGSTTRRSTINRSRKWLCLRTALRSSSGRHRTPTATASTRTMRLTSR
ncbi:hypothetical protein [Methylobrevis pamukkalensis]|uniref:Uncharacterized protein n=1 Tax=Methylobrevis pamukkalensis TaxID=1439726 RepID=A0A1E3GTA8_9HYPH|nr:hypothetical protein [Methylobrevis pamukkalensis]ODN67244.1 hypothetical protein A6302_04402 [Methylobrevis pamukkalensis]